jgi:superfamily II DNA or RNA helicase
MSKELFEAVRKKCPSGLWSQGVKLARDGAVLIESRSGSEITLRVRAPRFAVPPSVTVYPDDAEWSCDCGGRIDPCEHVAAAAIALHQGEAKTEEQKPRAHVGYRIVLQEKSLYLTRVIVRGAEESPLKGPLSAEITRSGDLVASHEDLALDKVLNPGAKVFLPVVRMQEILTMLAGASDVKVDGESVRTSGEVVMPRAVVRDAEDGVVLRIERDPKIDAVIGRGVVRVGEMLRPIGEVETTGDLLEKLPRVRPFPASRVAELVTDVLPSLEQKLVVSIESKKLPRRARAMKPRVLLQLGQSLRGDASLSVVPLLVYGDPPLARIDDNKLVLVQKGEVPMRDEGAERKLLQRLRDELNLVPGRRVDFHGPDARRFTTLLKSWAVHDPEQTILASAPLQPKIESDGEHFDVSFTTVDGKRASGAAAVRAWQEGLDLVPLDGGGWAPLPMDWLQKHGRRLADLLAARDEEGRVPKAAATRVQQICEALDQPTPPSFAALASSLRSFDRIPRAELPQLEASLRHYQQTGVDWLSFLRDHGLGAVLADDMGLGKTLQTIATMRGRCLVVAPRSVIHNWAAEIAKFRPSLRTSLYHGARRSLDRAADVTITTYGTLRLDIDALRTGFDIVVLDEAQAIKNPESQAARAAFKLDAKWRVALSGTPVENRLDELWSVFHFASRGLLGGRSDFHERFAAPIARGEEGAAERLRELIKPFLLRRLKKEVAPELPPRTDITLHVELEESERAVYDAVRAATQKDVLSRLQEGGSVLAALEALLRLRQAACHPSLVPGQRAESSSKVQTLLEALVDAASEGHKALVFSQWTSMLDLIEPHLRQESIEFTRLDGSTNDRAGVVAKFQSDDGPPVMLVSLKAGGTGLNLTAADHVFLIDPWWNPAVEDQAADRAHRIGQDKPVFVYRLVAKDTVEEGILALQERKRAVAETALAAGKHAGEITREDLLALLS